MLPRFLLHMNNIITVTFVLDACFFSSAGRVNSITGQKLSVCMLTSVTQIITAIIRRDL